MKELRSIGIQPDILLCRADREIPETERRKIALFCNVRPSAVIQALDVASIYDVPHRLSPRRAGPRGARAPSASSPHREPDLARWRLISDRIRNPEGEVVIAVVGKYTGLLDAYKSLSEALSHGGIANKVKVKLEWIESEIFEKQDPAPHLEGVNGILVPGGFGERGAEGKIRAATFARTRECALFRHLLRHADGVHRGGAQSRRHRRCKLHRIRTDRGAGGRPHDRMDEGQRNRDAQEGR